MTSFSDTERARLMAMADEMTELHVEMLRVIPEIRLLRRNVNEHTEQLEDHEFRLGFVERHVGIKEPRVLHRPVSVPPRSPEELGLKISEKSGVHYITDDVTKILQRFQDQENQRIGAEQALAAVRKEKEDEAKAQEEQAKRTDRLLNRLKWGGGALSFIAVIISYLLGHFHP